MDTHIKIFSSKLFGCQRRGCQSEGVSIKRPLSLCRYLKNILSAIVFRSYKVAVVKSSDLFSHYGKAPEKLELISFKNEVKILLETKIEQVRECHPSLRILFFKDNKGSIYSGYCSEEDKSYHITDLIQKNSKGVIQEESKGVTQGKNKGVTQGKNTCVIQEGNEGVTQGKNRCVIQEENEGVTQGKNKGVTQGKNKCVIQEENEGVTVTQGKNKCVIQEENEGVTQGKNKGVTPEENKCVIQEENEGVTQEENKGVTQEENKDVVQEENKDVVQEENEVVAQGENEYCSNVLMETSEDKYKKKVACLEKGITYLDKAIEELQDKWYIKVKNTVPFLLERQNMGYYSEENFNPKVGTGEEKKRLGFKQRERTLEFEKSMCNAEKITDMCIESLKEEYIKIMDSCEYSSCNGNLELANFWSMKDHEEYKKMQKDRLFTFVKGYISDEKKNQDISNDEAVEAKQKLSDLRSLAAIFWPAASMKEPFSLDELTQTDEFNEMAEHLFIFRFDEKKKLTCASIGRKNTFLDRKLNIIEMGSIKERIKSICKEAPSVYGNITKMNTSSKEINYLNEKAIGLCQDVKLEMRSFSTPHIYGIYEEAGRGEYLMERAIGHFIYEYCKAIPLSIERLEKEFYLRLSTVDRITKVFLENAIQNLSDKLNSEFKMGSLLSRELACRQIVENIEAETSATKGKKQIVDTLYSFGSCKMANEIVMKVFETLAKESSFWNEYRTNILMLRDRCGKSVDDEHYLLESMEVIYEDCLFKTTFLLEAYSDVDNKKVVFDDIDDKKKFSFPSSVKKGRMTHILLPAILGEDDRVVFQGKGNRIKKVQLFRDRD